VSHEADRHPQKCLTGPIASSQASFVYRTSRVPVVWESGTYPMNVSILQGPDFDKVNKGSFGVYQISLL
jgi:hypothetical protein